MHSARVETTSHKVYDLCPPERWPQWSAPYLGTQEPQPMSDMLECREQRLEIVLSPKPQHSSLMIGRAALKTWHAFRVTILMNSTCLPTTHTNILNQSLPGHTLDTLYWTYFHYLQGQVENLLNLLSSPSLLIINSVFNLIFSSLIISSQKKPCAPNTLYFFYQIPYFFAQKFCFDKAQEHEHNSTKFFTRIVFPLVFNMFFISIWGMVRMAFTDYNSTKSFHYNLGNL